MSTSALYAGSFDPLTRGHLDIINKSVQTFDVTYVAVGRNAAKKGFFPVERRLQLIESAIKEWENPLLKQALEHGRLMIGEFEGMSIIKYANLIGATHIARGLRQAGDFNDEFTLTGAAAHLDDSVIFTHFIGKEKYLHVSSGVARELASLNEDISWLVTPSVAKALRDEYALRAQSTQ